MERSAEWLLGAIEALNRVQRDFTVTVPELQAEYVALLAAAEAREAFPIPDTLPAVPEAREAGERDSIKLAKLIDGMFYCEGGGYDSDDVREGIQKAFEIGVQSAGKTETREAGKPTAAEVIAACEKWLEIARRQFGSHAGEQANEEMCEDALALIARWREANGGK